MKQKIITYLIGAQVAALATAYIVKAPDLSATANKQAAIRTQETERGFEQQEAISRAQSCLVLLSEMPITDGTAAYFSALKNGRIVIDKKRPLPDGTGVCDAFGNTGIVSFDDDGNPIVSDIKRMPPEQMKEILDERGVAHKNSSKLHKRGK